MRHYYRTQMAPAEALTVADAFFSALGLERAATRERVHTFHGPLGTATVSARPEGGHYTFIEVETDQVGESRLDRNVKRYFVTVHRTVDPTHRPQAAY